MIHQSHRLVLGISVLSLTVMALCSAPTLVESRPLTTIAREGAGGLSESSKARDSSNSTSRRVANQDERHTTCDFGSWNQHSLGCRLDDGQLTAGVTDLAVSSLGPDASVTRTYRSGAATSRYAPGWFFSFERSLDLSHVSDALGKVSYTDADNVGHDFYRASSTSAWQAPDGFLATLTQNRGK